MSQRFFTVSFQPQSAEEVVEVDQEQLEQIKGQFVWEIDDTIFPLKDLQEIKDYFFNLSQHANSTLQLPGFELIRHK